ncbi:hypothetical protein EOPP23_19100 [Endozoicomonas sp. OPT23]|nr:hypothetical protein [Endozoicomonas sp. OPT23]
MKTLKKIRRISIIRKRVTEAIKALEEAACYPSHDKVMAIVSQDGMSFTIVEFSHLWRMELYSETARKNGLLVK